jgi:hypothetical protein
LFAALCKHLKRQRISVDGAIKLIRYVVVSLTRLTIHAHT